MTLDQFTVLMREIKDNARTAATAAVSVDKRLRRVEYVQATMVGGLLVMAALLQAGVIHIG